jgi:hypothetical protein
LSKLIVSCRRLGEPTYPGHDREYEPTSKDDDDETGHGTGPQELDPV